MAPQLNREQQLASVSLSAGLNDGVALGDAVEAVKAIAEPLLPPGSRLVPLAELHPAGKFLWNGTDLRLCHRDHLPVLAAQFESVISGLIIMATVPLGLACAVFALCHHRIDAQRLQPDRPRAAGRGHGEERHSDRRVRQPAARPRAERARGDRECVRDPPKTGDDDDDRDCSRRFPLVLAQGPAPRPASRSVGSL